MLSSTLGTSAGPVVPTGTEFAGATSVLFLQFNADGSATPFGKQPNVRFLVATATVAAGVPQFNNPNAVRGIVVRVNGAIGSVSERNGF